MRNQEASDVPQLVNFAAPQVVIKQSVKKTFLQPFIIRIYIFSAKFMAKNDIIRNFLCWGTERTKIDRG